MQDDNDLRELLLKMLTVLNEQTSQAYSMIFVLEAIKTMSPDERAALTPQRIDQERMKAKDAANQLVQRGSEQLEQALLHEKDFRNALRMFLLTYGL
jgi:hypothetical protein